jgi:hypothetical protein
MLVGSKEIGLEVKADKTKYVVVFRDQNAGRCQNMKIDNRSFRRVENLKYLGGHPSNELKFYSRRNSEQIEVRECYHSV